MVYQKNLQISGTHHFVKVMCTRTILSMVFIYPITGLSCGTLINFSTQNKASDSTDKKRCHRFEVEERLLELLRRMKRLSLDQKLFFMIVLVSRNIPQNEPEVNIIVY